MGPIFLAHKVHEPEETDNGTAMEGDYVLENQDTGTKIRMSERAFQRDFYVKLDFGNPRIIRYAKVDSSDEAYREGRRLSGQ